MLFRLRLAAIALALAAGSCFQAVGATVSPYDALDLERVHLFAPRDLVITRGPQTTSNFERFIGRKLIVLFWRMDAPTDWQSIRVLAAAAAEQDIEVLAISVDEPDREPQARAFLQKNAPELEFWMAAPGSTRDWYVDSGLPGLYFIRDTGTTVGKAIGRRSWGSYEHLGSMLRELLK